MPGFGTDSGLHLGLWSHERDSEFDGHFPRIRSRLPASLSSTKSRISLTRRRISRTGKTGLVNVVGEIFRHRLFECIERVDLDDSNIHGLIIITDKHTQAMIEKTIGWINCKRFGVGKIFNNEDLVSNEFTSNLQVIYLINLIHIDQLRYKNLLNNLGNRVALNCSIFLTHLSDPFDPLIDCRLKSLQAIIDAKKLSPPWIVGAFNVINPWIAILDGEDPYLDFLRQKINRPQTSQNTNKNKAMAMKIAFRLVNVFEQMNQLPIIRYHKSSWHNHNRLIADLCYNSLESMKEKRRTDGNTAKYGKDYTLIILDRSCDLITPILHSNDLQAFVAQELELNNTDMCSLFMEESFRNISMTSIPTKLTEFFRLLSSKYLDMNFEERENAMKMVNNYTFLARSILSSIESGYSAMIAYESEILSKFGAGIAKSDNNILSEFFIQKREKENKHTSKEKHLQVKNFDLLRLVLLVTTLTEGKIKDVLKLVSKQTSLNRLDKKLVTNYQQFTKNLLEVNKIETIGLPFLSKVIQLYYQHSLPDEIFPIIKDKQQLPSSSHREKLCIYIVGGLSYNELKYAGSDGKKDIILLSSSFLTPKLLLSELFPHLFT